MTKTTEALLTVYGHTLELVKLLEGIATAHTERSHDFDPMVAWITLGEEISSARTRAYAIHLEAIAAVCDTAPSNRDRINPLTGELTH